MTSADPTRPEPTDADPELAGPNRAGPKRAGPNRAVPERAGPKLAAVVVTYNRRAHIEATVTRLLAEPLDVLVVVDNGSDDGSREFLRAVTDPRLDLIETADNIGGAGGFETGLRHVVATCDPDWVVVMDDDARPEPGALAAFREAGTAGDLAGWDAVAASVRYPDGRICEMNRPVLNPFWHPKIFLRVISGGGRSAFHLAEADYARTTPMPVDGGSFVGMFFSRQAIGLAGYPDGRLFIYAEDGLYSMTLSEAGGRIGFFPGIRFEHDCSTFSGPPGRFTPPWKAYYYHRNLLMLYRRAAGIWFWPALLVVLPKWLWKTRAQGSDKRTYLRHLGHAIRDGLTGRVGTRAPEKGYVAAKSECPTSAR